MSTTGLHLVLTEESSRLLRAGEADTEAQWRAALVHAEYLRLEYSQRSGAAETAELELEQLWVLLWRAEQRREALFRALESP
jgi:hypothetical protein